MEMKTRIALFLLISATSAVVLHPIFQAFTCTEPHLSFMDLAMNKLGIVEPRYICPIYSATAMEMLKRLSICALGCIMGYFFCREEKKQEVYSWHGWVPPAEDQAMLEEALREGFSTTRVRRPLF